MGICPLKKIDFFIETFTNYSVYPDFTKNIIVFSLKNLFAPIGREKQNFIIFLFVN